MKLLYLLFFNLLIFTQSNLFTIRLVINPTELENRMKIYNQIKLDNQLMLATFDGNIEQVKSLLANKANPNVKDRDGHTPLFIAAYNGNIEIAELLLQDPRTDPSLANTNGITPRLIAIQRRNIAIVNLLNLFNNKFNGLLVIDHPVTDLEKELRSSYLLFLQNKENNLHKIIFAENNPTFISNLSNFFNFDFLSNKNNDPKIISAISNVFSFDFLPLLLLYLNKYQPDNKKVEQIFNDVALNLITQKNIKYEEDDQCLICLNTYALLKKEGIALIPLLHKGYFVCSRDWINSYTSILLGKCPICNPSSNQKLHSNFHQTLE